ncbi:hypothetical protein OsccyDRAFT_3151 [Leptolyngbyaceae cyanobacterium JSC-12]|nr:hypothetical protein OsccyDRAFT_3151 [Leptolyngbyaceae cyanobacterium JSC-12]
MSLRSLQLRPISTSHYYVSGDVTIQAGVAIAPGVLLQADPDSQILIKSGACIGIGAILHAHSGLLEIGEGANVGAEVLLIGQVQIGANACIGAGTTILNSTIEPGQLVPPGSLIGDASRPLNELQATDTVIYPADTKDQSGSSSFFTDAGQTGTADVVSEREEKSTRMNVYGQVYVNRMFVKMFPHHPRSLSSLPDQNGSNPEDPWDD